tara:strand:+ start:98 stop:238 length:141 start_codon:yes stop_codon:yes gene_type:complete
MSPPPEFTEAAKLRIELYGFTTSDWWDHLTDSHEELLKEKHRRAQT